MPLVGGAGVVEDGEAVIGETAVEDDGCVGILEDSTLLCC